jgi:hypothetical protein
MVTTETQELKLWHAPYGSRRCGHLVLWVDVPAGTGQQALEDTLHAEIGALTTETCERCGERIERVECGIFAADGLTVEEPRLLEVPGREEVVTR